jgi:hypothetical protein
MARDQGRNLMRENIANIAARLMVEDGIEDYAQAKRKAARQAGAADSRQMPTNDEIDLALARYRDVFQSDHTATLRTLRELALTVMKEFAAFNPHLTGSILRGNAGRYADIHLQLFCDSPKSVEHHLLNREIPFRTEEARFYAGDMELRAAVLVFERDAYEVYMTLLSPRDLRLSLRTTPSGKPIERANLDAVARLLAQPD